MVRATQAQAPDSSGLPCGTLPGPGPPGCSCFRTVRDSCGKNSAVSPRTATSLHSFWRKRTTLAFSSVAGSLDRKSRGHDRSIIRCTDQPT